MTKSTERHVPVLLTATMEYLQVRAGSTVVDCTLGLAGHSSEIVKQLGPKGTLIAFDRDPEALALAKEKLDRICEELGSQAPTVTLIGEAFSEAPMHVQPASVDALLADFGVSSLQLDEAARGFSFMADGPLDMRMDTRSGPTAAAMKQDRIHPATRTFQALRIYVNRELDEIQALMEAAPTLLKPSGRLAVISFHSLEDRIVKDSLRQGAQQGIWTILTKKPAVAGEEEIERNPRSRSAKLRAAERQ